MNFPRQNCNLNRHERILIRQWLLRICRNRRTRLIRIGVRVVRIDRAVRIVRILGIRNKRIPVEAQLLDALDVDVIDIVAYNGRIPP